MSKHQVKHGENDSAARIAWLRRALAALFSLAVLSSLPTVARASCGDWLADPNHKMARQHWPLPGQNQPLPAPAPCNGPFCQKTPAAPSPVVPAPVFEHVDKLAAAASASATDPFRGESSLTSDSDVHPSKGFLPRIEHPPRA